MRAIFICELLKGGNRTKAGQSGAAMEEVVVEREACLAPAEQFLPCRDAVSVAGWGRGPPAL